MSSTLYRLSNQQFIEQFQNCSLAPELFNHIGHLRLTWLYLQHSDVEAAVLQICQEIKAYASHLDVQQKFHLSITNAIVRIIAYRLSIHTYDSWQQFLAGNADLVKDTKAVLRTYYSDELLYSELARTNIIPPDIKTF